MLNVYKMQDTMLELHVQLLSLNLSTLASYQVLIMSTKFQSSNILWNKILRFRPVREGKVIGGTIILEDH